MLAPLLCKLPSDLLYEIILIDDASTDATANWLHSFEHSFVKLLAQPTRLEPLQ